MKKRNSQKKLNGEIILMQNELMSKLANLGQPHRYTDDLGFSTTAGIQESDALANLISKSKNITQAHSREIQAAKKSQIRELAHKKIETEGTFLTGLGLAKQNAANSKSKKDVLQFDSYADQEESDADTMLRELIGNKKTDDLQQLRQMIKQTGCNLQGCSRKLNKSKKSIMHIADRYVNEVPSTTLSFLNSYRQFNAKDLQRLQDE